MNLICDRLAQAQQSKKTLEKGLTLLQMQAIIRYKQKTTTTTTNRAQATMIKKIWNIGVAKWAKWLHSIGLLTNETITYGGYSYPVTDFLAFSDAKILDIMRSAGETDDRIAIAFAAINELRKR